MKPHPLASVLIACGLLVVAVDSLRGGNAVSRHSRASGTANVSAHISDDSADQHIRRASAPTESTQSSPVSFGQHRLPLPKAALGAPPLTDKQWQLAQDVFMRYAKFHERNRGQASTKYLVWLCHRGHVCGGFADRVKGLANMLFTAMLSGRVFVVIHSAPRGISSLLRHNVIDWRIKNTPIKPPLSGVQLVWDGTPMNEAQMLHALSNKEITIWRCNVEPSQAAGLHLFKLGMQSAKTRNAALKRSKSNTSGARNPSPAGPAEDSSAIFHSYEEVEALFSLPLGLQIAMTYHFLFRHADAMVQATADSLWRRVKAWNRPFVGLHIRRGDEPLTSHMARTSVPKVPDLSLLLETANHCDGLAVYIASDDPMMVAAIQAVLPPSILALSCCGRAVHIDRIPARDTTLRSEGHQKSPVSYSAANAVEEIFTTYHMFSRSDAIVTLTTVHAGAFAAGAAYWELTRQVPVFQSFEDAREVMDQMCVYQ